MCDTVEKKTKKSTSFSLFDLLKSSNQKKTNQELREVKRAPQRAATTGSVREPSNKIGLERHRNKKKKLSPLKKRLVQVRLYIIISSDFI